MITERDHNDAKPWPRYATHCLCVLVLLICSSDRSHPTFLTRWNVKINQSLISIGFTPLHADRCVYVRRRANDIIIIALYVDDLLIASSRKTEMGSIKRMLTQLYEMEDMGEATFILGIAIRRERANRSISIGQSAYINTLLKRHGMADCNSTSTPMDSAAVHDLMTAADSYQASLTLTRDYQSIIGGLMFAATCATRHRLRSQQALTLLREPDRGALRSRKASAALPRRYSPHQPHLHRHSTATSTARRLL